MSGCCEIIAPFIPSAPTCTCGELWFETTDVSPSTTGSEVNLYSDAIAKNQLSGNGDFLEIKYTYIAQEGFSKVGIYFGVNGNNTDASIYSNTATTGLILVSIFVIRVSNTAVKITVNAGGSLTYANLTGLNLSGLSYFFTLTGHSNPEVDIIAHFANCIYFPAP